jgi:nucleotide-binding universal stress UspA family protein
VVREGFPLDVIAEEARKHGANLIALGTHGRTGAAAYFTQTVLILTNSRMPTSASSRP